MERASGKVLQASSWHARMQGAQTAAKFASAIHEVVDTMGGVRGGGVR